MNKKLFGFIFAFVLILLPTSNVLAVVNINTAIVETTSVTLLINGDLTKSCYDFVLSDWKDSAALTHPQIQTKEVCRKESDNDPMNPDDNYRVTFSDLRPGNEYEVSFKELGSTYSKKFKTAYNYSDLNGMISVVSTRLNDPNNIIVEGTEPGQYKVGSKEKLRKVLEDAEHLNGSIEKYTQSDIDVKARDLREALDTFELSKVGATVVTQTASDPNFDIKNNGIVPRCNVGPIDQKTGNYVTPCDFNFFMNLVNNVIKYLLFVIATPLIALIIMYTAYLYLTAGGNAGQVEKVKHILFNAVIGYVVALGAWLIINTIITSLNVDKDINTFMDRIDKVE